MEINNLEQILDLLEFDNQEDFYFMQIIMRRKENEHLESNSRVIKTYYIQNKQYLLDMFEEIKGLCNYFNARACISLNRRNFEKIAFHTLKKVTEQICNKDFFNVMNAYDKSCGTYISESDKKWIIDLDQEHLQHEEKYISIVLQCPPITGGREIFSFITTPNGVHMISPPFDLSKFKDLVSEHKLPVPDIHKNNPTILYYNKREV